MTNKIEFINYNFPSHLYFKEIKNKKQIVLHHTVSGRGVDGDINWWKQSSSRIATPFIINWDGKIYKLFDSKHWAHHIGVQNSIFEEFKIPFKYRKLNTGRTIYANNIILNEESIGIEIDAWGGLVRNEKNGLWYPGKWDEYLQTNIPRTNLKPLSEDRIYYYPNGYRDFFAYEKYTPEQIESTRKLLLYLGKKHKIPLNYNSDMWYVDKAALSGEPGIWSHTSYRFDKTDAHPQDDLIKMLQNLTSTRGVHQTF